MLPLPSLISSTYQKQLDAAEQLHKEMLADIASVGGQLLFGDSVIFTASQAKKFEQLQATRRAKL